MTGVTFPTNRRFIVWAFVSALTVAGLAGVATGTAAAQTEGGIYDRTEQVRDEILYRLPDISDCALVTDSDLASISRLSLWYNITELQSGDFQGLSNLTYLRLSNNINLRELPADVFTGLSNLEELNLSRNELSELPAGVFTGLSNLETLYLGKNDLSELPAGVFTGLSSLEELDLWFNDLSELPAGVFTGLSSLEELNLTFNDLEELPISIFDGLDNLKKLYLRVNPGVPFWYAGKKAGELEDHNGIRYADSHGDTPETATPLPYRSTIYGRLYPVTDVDYFKLEVTDSNKGYIDIWVSSSNSGESGVHAGVQALFDSEGNCVRRLCEWAGGTWGAAMYNLEPGTYYLRVISPYRKDLLDHYPDAPGRQCQLPRILVRRFLIPRLR